MDDAQLFIMAAQHAGFGAEAAAATLAWARGYLGDAGQPGQRLYIFRSSSNGTGTGELSSATPPARPRTLLAFRNADTALSFAQKAGLGRAPRLASMGIGHLLAALVQRPSITTLIVADDDDDITLHAGLPVGVRIERSALLDQLQIADCRL